jgi:hypothetical protein
MASRQSQGSRVVQQMVGTLLEDFMEIALLNMKSLTNQ